METGIEVFQTVLYIANVSLDRYAEEQVRTIANKHNVSDIQTPITISVICLFSTEEDLRGFVEELVDATV